MPASTKAGLKDAKRPLSKDGKGVKGAGPSQPPARRLIFPRTIVGDQSAGWLRSAPLSLPPFPWLGTLKAYASYYL